MKIKANVESFIDTRDIPYILNHPKFDLAIHTVRSKNIAASENVRIEGMALIVSAALNLFKSDLMKPFYEKAIFYTGHPKPDFISQGYRGTTIHMDEKNLKDVALATGSLPYLIRGVSGISGAPRGVYRDGGLINYQLNEDYYPADGLTLFFHYQEKITPGWFDKKLSWKKPSAKILDRVFQIYPGQAFLKMLPGEKIPDSGTSLHSPTILMKESKDGIRYAKRAKYWVRFLWKTTSQAEFVSLFGLYSY